MMDLFSSSALDFVYAGIVVISFIFALLSLIGLGIGEALDFDVDADADGFAECQGDCDDTNPSIGPGFPELLKC